MHTTNTMLNSNKLGTGKIVLILLTVVQISCSSSNESKTLSTLNGDDEGIIKNLKQTLYTKAYSARDTSLLDEILHDSFVLVDDNGDTYTKQDELSYIKNYESSFTEYTFEVERIDLFDNGTAIVFGKGIMKGETSDGAYIATHKSSDSMIKDANGSWSIIASHVSGVKEEQIENAPE